MEGSPEKGSADVLGGIRVIEVAHFAYVPAAGALLADWGAEVIKVEHPDHGDPMRGVKIGDLPPGVGGLTFMWELSNRGKRSIGIDLSAGPGRELLMALVETADVFLTSFLPQVRERLGIDEDSIRGRNGSIIYASGSGQGARGPEARSGGFDQISYWHRSGIASALSEGSGRPPDLPGPGFGDVTSGMALAGGVAAALLHRERTGEAKTVDGSLLATGMWAIQPSIAAAGLAGRDEFRYQNLSAASNPLVNTYRTSDGRFIGLCVIQSQKHWAGLCRAIGRDELIDDARFADADARAENSEACVAALEETFAQNTLDHWEAVLGEQEGQWAVVQQVSDLRDDPQVLANGYLQSVDYGGGRRVDLVPSPVQFDGAPPCLKPAPEVGSETESVLLELGLDWAELSSLKDQRVIT